MRVEFLFSLRISLHAVTSLMSVSNCYVSPHAFGPHGFSSLIGCVFIRTTLNSTLIEMYRPNVLEHFWIEAFLQTDTIISKYSKQEGELGGGCCMCYPAEPGGCRSLL